MFLTGCSLAPRQPPPEGAVPKGLAVLHQLMQDERQVADIFAIKGVPGETEVIIKQIAASADGTAKLLKQWRDTDEAPLEGVLPAMELAARDRIASKTTSALLFSGGKTFEVRLLLTQSEATQYAAALCAVLAEHLPEERAKQLTAVGTRFEKLHGLVVKRLITLAGGS